MTWAHPAWWRQLHSCVHNSRKVEKWMCVCSCVWKHWRSFLGGGCLKWHRWALAKVALQGHVGILCPLYLKEFFCRCFFRFWFLLLFDGSLVSVVKLNCECRILWEWERKQDRALTSNLTWSISERNREERDWMQPAPFSRNSVVLCSLPPPVTELSSSAPWLTSFSLQWSFCCICFILSTAWLRAARFPWDKGRCR